MRLFLLFLLYHGLELFQKLVDVLEFPVHGGEPDVGDLIDLLEFLHDPLANNLRRHFLVELFMDFDLDLAKSQSNDNPVYYIQYAHARVRSVLRQLDEKGLQHDQQAGLSNLHHLTESHEQDLLTGLSRYPEVVESAALNHEPHQIAHFLRELANDFHTYYNAHQFLVEAPELRDARLCLIRATRQVIANGLGLLGVSAPESM